MGQWYEGQHTCRRIESVRKDIQWLARERGGTEYAPKGKVRGVPGGKLRRNKPSLPGPWTWHTASWNLTRQYAAYHTVGPHKLLTTEQGVQLVSSSHADRLGPRERGVPVPREAVELQIAANTPDRLRASLRSLLCLVRPRHLHLQVSRLSKRAEPFYCISALLQVLAGPIECCLVELGSACVVPASRAASGQQNSPMQCRCLRPIHQPPRATRPSQQRRDET